MAMGRPDLEFDELEKLLCEIPTATCPHHSNTDQEPAQLPVNFPNAQKTASFGDSHKLDTSSTSFIEAKSSVDKLGVLMDRNLCDRDESLASAFHDLSFKDKMGSAAPSSFINSTLSPNPSPQLPNNSPGQQLMTQHLGYCQPTECPVIPNQQPSFFDGQSPLPYPHAQPLYQPHAPWRSIEEEYRMHQHQYIYLQQLRNQHLGYLVQENGNLRSRLLTRDTRQICRQGQFWNKDSLRRNIDQCTDVNTMRFLSHEEKQRFPEKILTRSHGLNPLRDVNQVRRVSPDNYFNACLTSTPDARFQLDSLSLSRQLVHKYNSIDDELTQKIYFMAKDQNGCRYLQRRFSEGAREDVQNIFSAIIVHVVELMTDPFGNYLVQKLLEVCDDDQRMQTLRAITRRSGDLVRIACDMHGTRAVQKVIETLRTPEQFSVVVSALRPGLVTLMKNMNGNHVAQRCLQYFTPEYNEFIFEAASVHCVELATDRHGCCVLQKCLGFSDGEQRRRLVYEITSNALILSQDQYGNYVVQYIFEIPVPWATADIVDQLEGNYGDLSVQKYSSNVVEKCLKHAGEERRVGIIKELMNNARLDQIMQDPYGNYVIQAAINLSKGALHDALLEAIRLHVPVLRTSPYGKKVLSSNGLKK